jgi:hypothetical protein
MSAASFIVLEAKPTNLQLLNLKGIKSHKDEINE